MTPLLDARGRPRRQAVVELVSGTLLVNRPASRLPPVLHIPL